MRHDIRPPVRHSAAGSLSHDRPDRAQGRDGALEARRASGPGDVELTGVRRAPSRGGSSSDGGLHVGLYETPLSGAAEDPSRCIDGTSDAPGSNVASCIGIVLCIACCLFDGPYWIARALIAMGVL